MKKIEMELLKITPFVRRDKTFNLKKATKYAKEVEGISGENLDYFRHLNISIDLKNVPLLLKILLSNEKSQTISEKKVFDIEEAKENIPTLEYDLYNKWQEIFLTEIVQLDEFVSETNILPLAQSNASYMVSVFSPINMVYTTSLNNLNHIIIALNELLKKEEKNELEEKLQPYIKELLVGFETLNLVDEKRPNGNHEFSLFAKEEKREQFNATYVTKYLGSFAQLNELQKNDFLNYEINFYDNRYLLSGEGEKKFYTPPLIAENEQLKQKWQQDMEKINGYIPRAQLVEIIESGTLEQFLLKVENSMCVSSQLELFNQTKATLEKYQYQLSLRDQFLMQLLVENKFPCKTNGDYCHQDCKIPQEKLLKRKI